jgi:hypothetical protein
MRPFLFLSLLLCALLLTACGARDEAPAAVDIDGQLELLEAMEAPEGVDQYVFESLRSALRAMLVDLKDGKAVAAAPVSDASESRLSLQAGSTTLDWDYAMQGDYDQNGEVNVADLTPIAIHFGKSPPIGVFGRETVESVVDGDGNGEINIGDLTPIGQNFQRRVTGYAVMFTTGEGFPAASGDPDGPEAIELAIVPFSAATGLSTRDRKEFTHSPGAQGAGFFYVRPVDETSRGTPSNSVQVEGGGEPIQNFGPSAKLFLSGGGNGGPPGTEINLDASSSEDYDDELPLAKFRFDPLGNNEWIDTGTVPLLAYTYENAGSYMARVEVTSQSGITDIGYRVILITDGTNDEVLGNDAPEPGFADTLTLPLAASGFHGRIDSDTGDDLDYLHLGGLAPSTFYALRMNYVSGIPLFNLVDSTHTTVVNGQDGGLRVNGSLVLEFTTDVSGEIAGGTGPYYLYISMSNGAQGATDYFIYSVANGAYDEEEPNDSSGQADRPLMDELVDYEGNVGSGPGVIGNDGDNTDLLHLSSVRPLDSVELTLEFDDATGTLQMEALDNSGEVIATAAGSGGTLTLNHAFTNEAFPYQLRISAASGYSDYLLNASWTKGTNPDYDEIEDNDTLETATPLPGLTFSGFRANYGSAGTYNGDEFDFFTLPDLAVGEAMTITLTYPQQGAFDVPGLQLLRADEDSLDNVLMQSYGGRTELRLSYRRSSIDPPHVGLRLDHFNPEFGVVGGVDYLISCAPGLVYDEVEGNDTMETANLVRGNPRYVLAEFEQATVGNIGGADAEDWYWIDCWNNQNLNTELEWDPADGAVIVEVFDDLGTPLVDSLSPAIADVDGHYYYVFEVENEVPVYFKVSAVSGTTDYRLRVRWDASPATWTGEED